MKAKSFEIALSKNLHCRLKKNRGQQIHKYNRWPRQKSLTRGKQSGKQSGQRKQFHRWLESFTSIQVNDGSFTSTLKDSGQQNDRWPCRIFPGCLHFILFQHLNASNLKSLLPMEMPHSLIEKYRRVIVLRNLRQSSAV